MTEYQWVREYLMSVTFEERVKRRYVPERIWQAMLGCPAEIRTRNMIGCTAQQMHPSGQAVEPPGVFHRRRARQLAAAVRRQLLRRRALSLLLPYPQLDQGHLRRCGMSPCRRSIESPDRHGLSFQLPAALTPPPSPPLPLPSKRHRELRRRHGPRDADHALLRLRCSRQAPPRLQLCDAHRPNHLGRFLPSQHVAWPPRGLLPRAAQKCNCPQFLTCGIELHLPTHPHAPTTPIQVRRYDVDIPGPGGPPQAPRDRRGHNLVLPGAWRRPRGAASSGLEE